MSSDRQLRGVIMPVLFILAGVVLLLNTLGLVEWATWSQVARLWPILIIGFGANLLLQHFRRTRP
jgi:cell wall-active antibiotic response 4TMS protein YvqF